MSDHEAAVLIDKIDVDAACDTCWTRKGFCGGKVLALEEVKR